MSWCRWAAEAATTAAAENTMEWPPPQDGLEYTLASDQTIVYLAVVYSPGSSSKFGNVTPILRAASYDWMTCGTSRLFPVLLKPEGFYRAQHGRCQQKAKDAEKQE